MKGIGWAAAVLLVLVLLLMMALFLRSGWWIDSGPPPSSSGTMAPGAFAFTAHWAAQCRTGAEVVLGFTPPQRRAG